MPAYFLVNNVTSNNEQTKYEIMLAEKLKPKAIDFFECILV